MGGRFKRLVARVVIPRYSEALDKANDYARFREWFRRFAPSMKAFESREALYRYVCADVNSGSPIDLLEFGVFRGESLMAWAAASPSPQSRFWGFDSFRGLPEDWVPGWGKGAYDLGGIPPRLPDPRIQLLKGDFRETIPPFVETAKIRSRLVMHVDCDLYASALYSLIACRCLLAQGSIVVFDEFPIPLHEFRAYLDFTRTFHARLHPLACAGREGQVVAFRVDGLRA